MQQVSTARVQAASMKLVGFKLLGGKQSSTGGASYGRGTVGAPRDKILSRLPTLLGTRV